jgi:hypothetical protein
MSLAAKSRKARPWHGIGSKHDRKRNYIYIYYIYNVWLLYNETTFKNVLDYWTNDNHVKPLWYNFHWKPHTVTYSFPGLKISKSAKREIELFLNFWKFRTWNVSNIIKLVDEVLVHRYVLYQWIKRNLTLQTLYLNVYRHPPTYASSDLQVWKMIFLKEAPNLSLW